MSRNFPLSSAFGVFGVVVALALASGSPRGPVPRRSAATVRPSERFATAAIHLERNVTDQDAEAVLEAVGGRCGLHTLVVSRPDDVVIAAYDSRERRGLGGREIVIESPEPSEARLLTAYPAGRYTFVAESWCGGRFAATSLLAHEFPLAAQVISPPDRSRDVARNGLVLRWAPVAGVDHYQVTIESESGMRVLFAELPVFETSLSIPESLLRAHAEYQLAIATFAANGNGSFVETTFITRK